MKTVKVYCDLPFNRVKVMDTGFVNFCCYQFTKNIGNLETQSFEEMWNSELANEVRNSVMGNTLHSMCKSKECPKYYQNLEKKYDVEINENNYPTTLEFDLHGSHCNYGGKNPDRNKVCIMCPRSHSTFKETIKKRRDKTFLYLEKLKILFPYLNKFIVLGLAEIFWEDKIFEILDFVEFEKYKHKITLEGITNGSVFDEESQLKFLKRVKKSNISFSLDAANAKTYKQIRKNNYFDVVIKNIESYVKKINLINNFEKKHYVSINANVNMVNIGEMADLIRLSKKLGVDEVILWPTHNGGGVNIMLPQDFLINENNFKLFKKVEKDCIEIANELQIKIHFMTPLDYNLSE